MAGVALAQQPALRLPHHARHRRRAGRRGLGQRVHAPLAGAGNRITGGRQLGRFPNQTIPRYTLSASGLSSNLRKVVAAQQLSLIRRPDAPICMRNLRHSLEVRAGNEAEHHESRPAAMASHR